MAQSLAQGFTSVRLTPLRKKDMGIRFIVAGETLRAIVSRYVLQQSAEESCDYLPENQKGFTPGSNGMQSAIYTVRQWSRRLGSILFFVQDRHFQRLQQHYAASMCIRGGKDRPPAW